MTDAFKCPSCGGKLSLEEMKGQNCPYCNVVLRHHARAAEQAALVNQVFQQQFQQNPNMFGGAPPPQIGYTVGAPPPQYVEAPITAAAKKSVVIWLVVSLAVVVLVFGIVGVALLFAFL